MSATDPPPAAPLTAEQIAAMREQYGPENGLVHYEPQIVRLLDEHAALRDRLARAETRERILRAGIRKATAMTHGHLGRTPYSEPSYNAEYMHKILNQTVTDADATPTDGAARAGDAAGDEEAGA